MSDRTARLVNKGVPWSRDVWWPIVALEAAVLIAVGLFMLVDTDRAGNVVLQLIGVGLLVASLGLAYAGIRDGGTTRDFFDAFRAGIGVTCGMVATASWWSDYIQSHAVRIILGWGLVAWALLQITGLVAAGRGKDLRLSTIGVGLLSLVLGIVLLTGDDVTSSGRVRTFGVVLMVFGVLLAVLAYVLSSRSQNHATARSNAT